MNELPERWQWKKVGEIGKVQLGRQRAPQFTEGELHPYLRVANVFDGYIDSTQVNTMYFTEKEYKTFKLDKGDILLNEGQSIELVGRPAMYSGQPSNCCFQNSLIRFKSSTQTTPNYALQLFQFCLYSGKFSAIALQTTSIAHLGLARLANLEVPLPPLPEQRAIVAILDSADAAVRKTQALIDAKIRYKCALADELLNGTRRFAEFEHTGPWRKVALANLASITMGQSPASADYNTEGLGLPLIQGNADIKNSRLAAK